MKPMKTSLKVIALSLAGLGAIGAEAVAAPSAVIEWNNAILEAIRATRNGPPQVARILAVSHTCMYDAWAAYDANAIGTRLGGTLRRPAGEHTEANKAKAINYAAYRALVDLFPSEKPVFDAKMAALGYNPISGSNDKGTPEGIGNVACKAVLDFRHADGSNQLGNLAPGAYSDYTGYQPVNTPDAIIDPNRWQPLRHGGVTQKYIAPHWGNVVPFALKSLHQYKIKAPAQAGSNEYLEQAKEVLSYSASLTDTGKVIAEYWADGPRSELPPGHWSLFAQYVSERDGYNVDKDAKMFFALTNALLDASVWTWGIKRQYDYIRPISAIHYLFNGQQVNAWAGPYLGTQSITGASWRPYQVATFVTPPFAEYVSGHSTFSASAAEVLKRFTGSDVFGKSVTIGAGTSRVEPGTVPANDLTLSWATFTDAADEAGSSRRYGGIHFLDGDLEGRRVGHLIGAAALKKANSFFYPEVKPKDSDD